MPVAQFAHEVLSYRRSLVKRSAMSKTSFSEGSTPAYSKSAFANATEKVQENQKPWPLRVSEKTPISTGRFPCSDKNDRISSRIGSVWSVNDSNAVSEYESVRTSYVRTFENRVSVFGPAAFIPTRSSRGVFMNARTHSNVPANQLGARLKVKFALPTTS